MPQNVPPFRFSDDALRVRQFVYAHWCAHGRGPNLREVHEATGLGRIRLLEVYRELDLGLVLTIEPTTQQGALLKCQPFSSYPSQVAVHLDGRFHCWAGCAMESIAISLMPPFAGKAMRLESYCACCLAPVRLVVQDGAIVSREPASILIHVSHSPRDWNVTNIVCMCDGMNFVYDADHALAYERQISRRGVVLTIEQAQRFVAGTGQNRMHRYDWEPVPLIPERVIAGLKALGVDVSPWGA
ncbi:MAG TPA: organomercurial lyase [Candidatus Limnocylindria bacterium]|nr:organomercurial lyase [Candidatus Limnocylindria bacterium]